MIDVAGTEVCDMIRFANVSLSPAWRSRQDGKGVSQATTGRLMSDYGATMSDNERLRGDYERQAQG